MLLHIEHAAVHGVDDDLGGALVTVQHLDAVVESPVDRLELG
jgi:hypothetical protein